MAAKNVPLFGNRERGGIDIRIQIGNIIPQGRNTRERLRDTIVSLIGAGRGYNRFGDYRFTAGRALHARIQINHL